MSAAPMRFLNVSVQHPDRNNPTPSHAVLRVTTPGGALREIHLSEVELERLASSAVAAITLLGRIRREAAA